MFQDPREIEQFQPRRRVWPWVGLVLLLGIVTAIGVTLFRNSIEEKPPAFAHPTLPEKDREFLWDAEHAGLEVVNFGWKPLMAALAADDRDEMAGHFGAAFRGQVSQKRTGKGIETSGLIARSDAVDERLQTLSAGEFVGWLREFRRRFADEPQARFKLTEVRPAEPQNRSGHWLGSGRLTIEGTSVSGGPRFDIVAISFRTVAPSEANLQRGGWLQECAVEQISHGESPEPLMREVAVERGLEPARLHDNWTSKTKPVNTGGIYCCDYNRDGCVDVLVTDRYVERGLILYRGTPEGRFDDVSLDVALPRVPHAVDAIFADLDGDGWEDLIIPGQRVLRNDRGRRFVDVTHATNLDVLIFELGFAGGMDAISGVSVVDFNRDGLMDVYVTRADVTHYNEGSWVDGASGDRYGNQLLENLGNWSFRDVTMQMNAHGGARSTFTSVWLDANNDNDPDVYVIHEFGPGALLVNRGGRRFEEVNVAAESSDFGSMGLTCGDVDNDGWVDLYVSNMYSSAGNRVMDNLPPGFYDETTMSKLRRMVVGNELHRNMGQLQFDSVGGDWGVQQVGWGWGPTLADFNNDGWLDIYATCGFMSRDRQKPDG